MILKGQAPGHLKQLIHQTAKGRKLGISGIASGGYLWYVQYVDGLLLNEYTVLYMFCAGVFIQSLFVIHAFKHLLFLGIVFCVCMIPAWYIPAPDDRAFASPLCWAVFYCIVFSIVFHKWMLPALTAFILLLYTGLLYYVLYLSAQSSGVMMPLSVMIGAAIPGVLVVLASLSGMLRYRAVRALCYGWYLVSLCLMIGCQWTLEDLARLYSGGGFSSALFVHVFLGGGVLLVFVSSLIQLFFLIPEPTRPTRRIVLDAMTGPIGHGRDQQQRMASRFVSMALDRARWCTVILYFLALYTNTRLNAVPHGIVVNVSIIAIFWFLMPRELKRHEDPGATDAFVLSAS